LTSNIVIQEDEFLDIIDQMRGFHSREVKSAKRPKAEREGSSGARESRRVIEMAREKAKVMTEA